MDLSDEVVIEAPRDQVYAALNDIEILKQCIPGCEELTRNDDDELEAKVVLKIGPVKARFSGTVRLDQSGAPEHFTLSGEGNGGTAGFAKGGADVTLTEETPGTTVLRYTAHADIGGKLAQLGSRLVQSTAKKLSAKFFQSFKETFDAEATA
jgi:carbon monoxide dehydrogenase subunit G